MGVNRLDVPVGHPRFGQLVPCECKAEEIARRLADRCGMHEEEMMVSFSQVILRGDTAKMVKVAQEFISSPYGILTLWGGEGNGKTLVLQATVNEMRWKYGLIGVYITFVDLMDYIREGFDKEADVPARQRYDQIVSAPVLAVDEVDKANITNWGSEFRTRFFDDRYRRGCLGECHTLLAMNEDPRELPGYIYGRLADGRNLIFHNRDDSFRPAMGTRGDMTER